ncbi:MAG: fibronectin type III domain-containing protein [Pseudomonadota bacterium]
MTALGVDGASAAGTMTVADGATVFVLGGTTDADVVVERGGRISSVGGATPNSGCASLTGLELQPGSLLEIAVGGISECDDHTGFLASTVSLSGAFLEVTDVGGYVPALNDEIVFLFTGTSEGSGQFANGGPQETVTIGGVPMSIESDGGSGNDFSLVYRSRPSDPIIENIDTVVSGEAEVTFTVENVGASALTAVNALCTSGLAQASGAGTGNRVTVTGLNPDLEYTCVVTAQNASGASTSLVSSPFAPVALAGLPVWLLFEATQ